MKKKVAILGIYIGEIKGFLFAFLILTLQISQIYAQSVHLQEAEKAAQNFVAKTHKSALNCVDMSINGSDTLFYVFNTDNGFVIISGDKKTVPILAYSTDRKSVV